MYIVDSVVFLPVAPTYTYQARPTGYRSRFWGGGTPGTQQQPHNQDQTNYNRYTGGMSEEEQMAQAMRESRQQSITTLMLRFYKVNANKMLMRNL